MYGSAASKSPGSPEAAELRASGMTAGLFGQHNMRIHKVDEIEDVMVRHLEDAAIERHMAELSRWREERTQLRHAVLGLPAQPAVAGGLAGAKGVGGSSAAPNFTRRSSFDRGSAAYAVGAADAAEPAAAGARASTSHGRRVGRPNAMDDRPLTAQTALARGRAALPARHAGRAPLVRRRGREQRTCAHPPLLRCRRGQACARLAECARGARLG